MPAYSHGNTLKEEFKVFMKNAYSSVPFGSPQWVTMEVVWNSAAFFTAKEVFVSEGVKLMELKNEAETHCMNFIKLHLGTPTNNPQ